MTDPSAPSPWPPLAIREAGAEGIYRGNPDRFTGPPSRFGLWAFQRLSERFPRGQLLELGCGTGRDARKFRNAMQIDQAAAAACASNGNCAGISGESRPDLCAAAMRARAFRVSR